MSDSLDRLKALRGRLEEKLEAKNKTLKSDIVEKKEVPEQNKIEPKIESVVEKDTIRKDEVLTVKESSEVEKKIIINDIELDSKLPKKETTRYTVRQKNIILVQNLYEKLKIFEKSPNFNNIFMYKAMNLSGIGLKAEDFAEVREGKYIQIIAITYEPDKNGKKKAKNISLGYFGKAETLDKTLKNEIIEFVLRWRYEKAFQNLEHYKELIAKVKVPS